MISAPHKSYFHLYYLCPQLRQYPGGFGQCLLKLHDEVKGKPHLDLRQKVTISPFLTDLQVFRGMSNDDCWVDAQLPNLFLYLYANPNLRIPDEWYPAMQMTYVEMSKYATCLKKL